MFSLTWKEATMTITDATYKSAEDVLVTSTQKHAMCALHSVDPASIKTS